MLLVVSYLLTSPHIRIIRSYYPFLTAYPIRVAALQTNDLYTWALSKLYPILNSLLRAFLCPALLPTLSGLFSNPGCAILSSIHNAWFKAGMTQCNWDRTNSRLMAFWEYRLIRRLIFGIRRSLALHYLPVEPTTLVFLSGHEKLKDMDLLLIAISVDSAFPVIVTFPVSAVKRDSGFLPEGLSKPTCHMPVSNSH